MKKFLLKLTVILVLTIILTSCCPLFPSLCSIVISSINVDRDICGFEETIQCEVVVAYEGNNPLDISWSLNGYGYIEEDPANQKLATFTSGNTEGTATITVRVSDNNNPAVEDSVRIIIDNTGDPVIDRACPMI